MNWLFDVPPTSASKHHSRSDRRRWRAGLASAMVGPRFGVLLACAVVVGIRDMVRSPGARRANRSGGPVVLSIVV
jgi:hypothetical protein